MNPLVITLFVFIALVIGLCVGLWPCDEGFNGRGVRNCEDIDECADGALHDCHEDAICTNTIGSWVCACEDGYEGSGQACFDVNECTSGISLSASIY